MTTRYMKLTLQDVIRPSLVDSSMAAEILDIKPKTWHNKVAEGLIPFKPVGQLVVSGRLSYTIWLRREVEALAAGRKK